MTYPKTPNNDKEAICYADYLTDLNKEQYIPIRRKTPIRSKFAINFTAVTWEEFEDILAGWEQIK